MISFIEDLKFQEALMMGNKVIDVLEECFYKNTKYIKNMYFDKIQKAESKLKSNNTSPKKNTDKKIDSSEDFTKTQYLFDEENSH